MKVLSIKEPFASLIKNGKKTIETRSWKTNYRGELYIHASKSKMSKDIYERKDLIKLIGNDELSYEYIVCKCNLKDCVLMTKEYIELLKKEKPQELICGLFEEGRYAWVLDDITVLDKPIKAKGKLGIWNYDKTK